MPLTTNTALEEINKLIPKEWVVKASDFEKACKEIKEIVRAFANEFKNNKSELKHFQTELVNQLTRMRQFDLQNDQGISYGGGKSATTRLQLISDVKSIIEPSVFQKMKGVMRAKSDENTNANSAEQAKPPEPPKGITR